MPDCENESQKICEHPARNPAKAGKELKLKKKKRGEPRPIPINGAVRVEWVILFLS